MTTTPASSARSLRVLMLCGYLQSAQIFSGRLGNLRKATKSFAELVFVDPPLVIEGDDNPDKEAPPLSSLKPEEHPRGWWTMRGEAGRRSYNHFDEFFQFIREILEKQGPFDGVLGFSQGAGAAAVITGLLEKPQLNPIFENINHAPFKFCIIAAGFEMLDPRAKVVFEEPLITPSLHIIGQTDALVTNDRSIALSKQFVNSRVEFHDGGHFIPSKTPWRNFLKSYIEVFIRAEEAAERSLAVPGPQPSSGTATPSDTPSGAATPAEVEIIAQEVKAT
ncbi:FSH1-domain-containing protein [Meredithblackwellia eburnea MCA 4105]